MSQSSATQARAAGPLYLQVASTIRRRIETGAWAPGSRMPTLDELAAEFSMARVTVRQALALLEDEGLIRRHQGRGTFVADRLPERQWLRLGASWPALLETVSTLSPKLLVLEDSARQPDLEPGEGTPAPAYKFMRRVHSTAEGTPYCLISIYLDQRIFRQDPVAFETQTVLPLLETHGVTLGSAHQTLTIGSADAEAARHLSLPLNAPIAEVHRVVTDANGCAVYVADLIYRGDVVKLDIDLLGGAGR